MLDGQAAHKLDPQAIRTIEGLNRHLCSLAWDTERRELYPHMCENCVSACRYGERLLQLTKEENHEGKAPENAGRVPDCNDVRGGDR